MMSLSQKAWIYLGAVAVVAVYRWICHRRAQRLGVTTELEAEPEPETDIPAGAALSRTQAKPELSPYMQRLLNPQFADVEAHFGVPLPACVQALYLDREELMQDNFWACPRPDPEDVSEDTHFIDHYIPCDQQTLVSRWGGTERYFPFASDGTGNNYPIDPQLDDPPVLQHDHETGEILEICPRFTDFRKWYHPEFRD